MFRRGCWNCILRVHGNFLRKNIFFSIFFSFLDTEHFVYHLPSCQNWIFGSKGIFRLKTFCKTWKHFFWKSSWKTSAGCREKSAGFSICFLLLHGQHFVESIYEKLLHLLWTLFRISSGSWAETVWPAWQNCNLRIYKIILKKTWISSSFSDIEQENFGFLSSFSTGMLELHSTGPRYHFKEERCFF